MNPHAREDSNLRHEVTKSLHHRPSLALASEGSHAVAQRAKAGAKYASYGPAGRHAAHAKASRSFAWAVRKLKEDTIREQAIAECPCGQCSTPELQAHGTPDGIRTRDLFVISDATAIFTTDRGKRRRGTDEAGLPLRAKPHALPGCATDFRLAGFEPATLRYHEVPELFTTGLRCAERSSCPRSACVITDCANFAQLRPASRPSKIEWQGTGDAELLPKKRASVLRPVRIELTTSAFAVLNQRSNRHLHHCHHAGERSKSALSDANASASLRKNRSPRRNSLREAASTVRDTKGGIRTRFSQWSEVSEIFTTSVHEAANAANQIAKRILS